MNLAHRTVSCIRANHSACTVANYARSDSTTVGGLPRRDTNVSALLAEIASYIHQYVTLSDEAAAISAGYILLTWVYDAFNDLPYLRFRGDYGTGKSRALIVIGSLCYKAFFASGASTVSPIFHTLDTFKGALIFDEADFRFSDEKAELVKIFNNGNIRGFPVLRNQLTLRKEYDPRAFSIFGPKLVAMRGSYDDRALESRFLTITMEPGRSGSAPINLPDRQQEEALGLRNKLLMYRLRYRRNVTLDPSLADDRLESRMNQILIPLLSIVPDKHVRDIILENCRELQAGIVADRNASADGQAVSVLNSTLAGEPGASASLADITAAFIAAHGADYDRPINNRWIGAILRRLGIALYKSNGIIVTAPGQGDRIAALAARYGVSPAPGR